MSVDMPKAWVICVFRFWLKPVEFILFEENGLKPVPIEYGVPYYYYYLLLITYTNVYFSPSPDRNGYPATWVGELLDWPMEAQGVRSMSG